ncbi:THAP7 protein, partial [Picathartes gymnocephalus]|nr:THAP7 protein [Picathartes gymnocephalus]
MPRHCSAAGCCTRDTRDTRDRGISFHRLPRREDPRRAQWLENSRRRDPAGGGRWDPRSKYIYFCSQHFQQSCFELVGYRPSSGIFRLPRTFRGSTLRTFRTPWGSPQVLWSLLNPLSPPTVATTASRKGLSPPSLPWVPPSPLGPPGRSPPCRTVTPRSPSGAPASGSESWGAQGGGHGTMGLPSLFAVQPPGPPSPSLFMLRLPPRAGSYIQSEHSYQVGSALLWKRRAEAALDALDKAQRQLQAGKRREQRLRLRLAELQRDR